MGANVNCLDKIKGLLKMLIQSDSNEMDDYDEFY